MHHTGLDFQWTACTECILLAMMVIDLYVAICWTLQYTLFMLPSLCVLMAAASWSSGLANALLQTTLTFQLAFCGQQTLDNLFCQVPVLIKLACCNTSANELFLIFITIPLGMVIPLLVVISYTFIARAVLKFPSAEGRHKTLSPGSSHLLVITIYFAPGIYMYLQLSAQSTQDKFLSFFYCVITPVLNPLIYNLRNKDVKTAWKGILQFQHGLQSLKAR
ncbi:Olfactory receptor 2B11 [Heterocephalus glaber]|uniref:Olfactory receptor 2B11 n=1 Tax=Heterocephalus glaber TaxID=10181 RepID=G5B1V0_HETGA|nr:Olfactory receptor 2B11 [Heterocephalus glaber]